MKTFLKSIFTVVMSAFLVSCERDALEQSVPADPDSVFSLEQVLPEAVETKSVNLKGMNFDTKKSVTLAAYTGGKLFAAGYYTTSLSAMKLDLENGKTYMVYALVNMGDQRSNLPRQESGLSSFEYELSNVSLNSTSSTSLKTMGVPMSGSLSYTVGTSTSSAIPVVRLFAKVYVDIEIHLPGLTANPLNNTKVCNLNRVLKPFGTSAAASPSDMYSGYDYSDGSSNDETGVSRSFSGGVAYARLILYVPENRQGTISGITSSRNKNMDLNTAVAAKSNVLTYLETTVTIPSGGTYSGTVVYRSYLGNNATTNFDIERNKEYNWKIKYYEDGLQYNDWKVVTEDLSGTRYRYAAMPSSISLNVGGHRDWQVYRYTDTFSNGIWTNGTTGTILNSSNDYTFSLSNSSIGRNNIQNGYLVRFIADAVGTGNINISITSDGTQLSIPVTVSAAAITYGYALSYVTPSGTSSSNRCSLEQGVPMSLAVQLTTYTYTNGTLSDTHTDVLDNSVVTWSSSNISVATVTNSGSNKGVVTGGSAGNVNITARYTPSGSSQLSTTAYFTVNEAQPVTTYVYELSYVDPANTTSSSRYSIQVGYSKTLRVKCTKYAVTNGVRTFDSEEELDNSVVTWSSSNISVATVTNSGSNKGVVTGVSAGNVNITARYTPSGYSQISTVAYLSVSAGSGGWNDDWDEDGNSGTVLP